MAYPAQAKRRKVLEYLYRKLNEMRANSKSRTWIILKKKINGDVILKDLKPKEVVNERLGLSGGELKSIITELRSEGFLRAKEDRAFGSNWWIYHLTDAGLREIGELSDPQAELMQRLDLAIVQIQLDQRLSETQKRQTINWLEEGKLVARTLTIDAIKAIVAGAIL